MRWELRAAGGDQRRTGCMRSRAESEVSPSPRPRCGAPSLCCLSAREDRKRGLNSADGRTDQWQDTDRWRTAPQANISGPEINISCTAASIPLPSFP